MICVLPFCLSDAAEMLRLVKWIQLLGPCKNHDALIVTDAAVPVGKVNEVMSVAEQAFARVKAISNDKPVAGWPNGSNSLFHTASKYIYQNDKAHWLWLESDAIPLKTGWLDTVQSELDSSPVETTYIGHIYEGTPPNPKQAMSGVAIYKWTCYLDFEDRILNSSLAWDMDLAHVMVSQGRHTNLIHHLWGEFGKPPVFAEKAVLGTEVLCLEQIPKDAVIWHREKQGSLVRLLKKRLFPDLKPETKIDVVFPVCMNDCNLAIAHAKWLIKMGRKWDRRAVIAFDRTLNLTAVNDFKNHLIQVFSKVDVFMYPTPPIPVWPNAPNWAFQHTAYHMSRQDNPWFWVEADACVLKPDWLEVMESEYESAGKPFMGPKVAHLGHCNGVAVYPANSPSLIPTAFKCTDRAWDYECAREMVPHLHNASHLLQHVWTITNGEVSEVQDGHVPTSITAEQAKRWLKSTAVLVHRFKTLDLVNLLMSGAYP